MSNEIFIQGDLPHWYVPGATHFITFRLAKTMPREVLQELHRQRETWLRQPLAQDETGNSRRQRVHKKLFARYDQLLDQGHGDCWLRDPSIAALMKRSLYHLHGRQYDLRAYCIMPNHVHVLLVPFADSVRLSHMPMADRRRLGGTGDRPMRDASATGSGRTT